MKLPEQWAPLKLNLLLGIVALQFTFASIAFIVRFNIIHRPATRWAETNVRAGPSPPLPLSPLLLQHRLTGRRAKLRHNRCILHRFVRDSHGEASEECVSKFILSCLLRGCFNRTDWSYWKQPDGCDRIKEVTGHAVLQTLRVRRNGQRHSSHACLDRPTKWEVGILGIFTILFLFPLNDSLKVPLFQNSLKTVKE